MRGSMATADHLTAIVEYLARQQLGGSSGPSAGAIQAHVGRPRPTVNRALAALVGTGRLERHGGGRSIVYRMPQAAEGGLAVAAAAIESRPRAVEDAQPALPWSAPARALIAELSKPLGTRQPVSYQRAFVDDYKPNESALLPAGVATRLYEAGKSRDQQPAGTYARKVLEQLLIDLSWYSSRLEGNRKSLLDTRELFVRGRSVGDDLDTTMLLNHKEAIEFTVDAVPAYGITVPVVRNIQSLLM